MLWQRSSPNYHAANAMTDHLGPIGIVEMAADRVAHRFAQGLEIIGLGEDGVAECARDEAAFRSFLDRKDDLARSIAHAEG
jgi:hypothetical protein